MTSPTNLDATDSTVHVPDDFLSVARFSNGYCESIPIAMRDVVEDMGLTLAIGRGKQSGGMYMLSESYRLRPRHD